MDQPGERQGEWKRERGGGKEEVYRAWREAGARETQAKANNSQQSRSVPEVPDPHHLPAHWVSDSLALV